MRDQKDFAANYANYANVGVIGVIRGCSDVSREDECQFRRSAFLVVD